jgi:hypothetical protein
MEDPDSATEDNSVPFPKVQPTFGEMLPRGVVIDLALEGSDLLLLISDGKRKPFTVPYFEYDGVTYSAGGLDASVLQATRFPGGASNYGSSRELFAKLCDCCCKLLRLPEGTARWIATWILCTWLPEVLPLLPTLVVIGRSIFQASNLFRLLGTMVRRPLRVGELTRDLPFCFRPTLLVNGPVVNAEFWRAMSDVGVFVSGPRGTLRPLACAKAVLVGPGHSEDRWGEEAMRVQLLPTEAPALGDALLNRIAADLQPQLQHYRFDFLRLWEESSARANVVSSSPLGRTLLACVDADPEIAKLLAPELESYQQDLQQQRALDPLVAILEAIWGPSHEARSLSVTEITKRVNALLRSRGGTYDFNAREIGWRLRNLDLDRRNNGRAKVLQFTPEIRARVHRLVRQVEVRVPAVPGCRDCGDPEKADSKTT